MAVRGALRACQRHLPILQGAVRDEARTADHPTGSEGRTEQAGATYAETLDVLHVQSEVRRRVG